MKNAHIEKLSTDNFEQKYGTDFVKEVELYFANCNLDEQWKIETLTVIEKAFEIGKIKGTNTIQNV